MHAKLNYRYIYLNENERFWDCSCESKRKHCHSRKSWVSESYLTCYIRNYSFFNSWLLSLNENSDQQKLQGHFFKNLEVKCLLWFTDFLTNSLFFRICKMICKIGLLIFRKSDEPFLFSLRLPFLFYVPLSLLR